LRNRGKITLQQRQLLIKYIKQYLATPHKGESHYIEELEKRLLKIEQILAELARL
jgi:hypothetical protein